jgi:hypothetical protein
MHMARTNREECSVFICFWEARVNAMQRRKIPSPEELPPLRKGQCLIMITAPFLPTSMTSSRESGPN